MEKPARGMEKPGSDLIPNPANVFQLKNSLLYSDNN